MTVKHRPFHEAIVHAIKTYCVGTEGDEIILIFMEMIKRTTIPEGHDEIIAAIDKYFSNRAGVYVQEIYEVKDCILHQKQLRQKEKFGTPEEKALRAAQKEVARFFTVNSYSDRKQLAKDLHHFACEIETGQL